MSRRNSFILPHFKVLSLSKTVICRKTGEIYSFVAVFQCLTGQLRLHGGSLKVLGKAPLVEGHIVPGRGIGYMPQETALYMEFTVAETMYFFARYDFTS